MIILFIVRRMEWIFRLQEEVAQETRFIGLINTKRYGIDFIE
jgi:hypothetical protein